MGLAGIDDAFELGVGEQAVRDDGRREMRAVARLGRRDGRHGRRLDQPRRMRLGIRDADRLEGVALIERLADAPGFGGRPVRSEEHTSELQSLMRISYAVFCLKKKNKADTIPVYGLKKT